MPHLHLSLQAGDDMILKRMKRRHLRADALAFCEAVRAARPGHRLRRRPHRRLPDRDRGDVREHAAAGRGVRADLPARLPLQPARRHAGRADAAGRARAAIRERAARLRAAGAERVAAAPRGDAGRPVRLLMERPDLGRTEGFAQTRLAGPHRPGAIVEARITGTADGQLLAEAA